MTSRVEISTLHTPSELACADDVLRRVWGVDRAIVVPEMMRAIVHAGGYVAGAFANGDMIAASVGILADHRGARALHSHVTGVVPDAQLGGVGRQIKRHQHAWATERNIEWITWTFDPLVRRNARFNIAILGARISEYIPNFYGEMSDALNGTDDSDRVVAAWPTEYATVTTTAPDTEIRVETPRDIVALRRCDPDAATRWRRTVRHELGTALANGGTVTGFSDAGEYIITYSPSTSQGTS